VGVDIKKQKRYPFEFIQADCLELMKDMDFLNMKKEAEQQIYKNMGVPIQLVIEAGSTYNNKSEAKLQFYEDTVIPFGKDNLNSLNTWLLPLLDKTGKLELRVDEKNIDALMIKRDLVNKTINDDPTITINEKRKLKGLPPIEGGDKIVTATGVSIAGSDASVDYGRCHSSKKKFERKADDQTYITDASLIALTGDIDTVALQVDVLVTEMFEELLKEFGEDQAEEIGRLASFQNTASARDFIADHTAEFITQIDDTTKKEIKDLIRVATDKGESLASVAARIHAKFDMFKKSRAKLIAVTETTAVYGFASREAMDQAGIEKSVWLTTMDGHERAAHRKLNQKVSDDDGMFHVDGQSANRPGGFSSASMNINCRCAIRPYFEGEAEDGKAAQGKLHQKTATWSSRDKKREKKEALVISTMVKVFDLQEKAFFKKIDELL